MTDKIIWVTFFRIKFIRHMIMSLLWENRWFEKEIISVLRLTRKWSSQSISNSEVFFRHFWRFELGTVIISGLFLDFSKVFKNSDTLYQPFYLTKWLITTPRWRQVIWYMQHIICMKSFSRNFNGKISTFWAHLSLIDCEPSIIQF